MYLLNVKDRVEIARNDEDFAEIVKEYMGVDSFNIVSRLIADKTAQMMKFNSDFFAYERQLDSYHTCLVDILEICESMDSMDKPNSAKILREKINEIKRLVNNGI